MTRPRSGGSPPAGAPGLRGMLLWVFVAALGVRLAHLAFIRGHPFYDLAAAWTDSDMHQFLAWARHLAAGDWLDRATFRPWFDYQGAIAPPEVWHAWYGPHVYYQPPLYPYLMAAVLALTGSVDLFRLAQVALGALNCGLMAMAAARISGARAGWIAGLLAAVYAPFVLYDGELLRGTVVTTAQVLLLLALLRWHTRRAAGTAALAGGAFGLAFVADPAILLFAPLAAIWMAVCAGGETPRAGRPLAAALRPPALFAAGALVALLPLAARNAAVGAPLLSATTRGPLAFVMGNAPDARPAGAHVPPSTGSILRASQYRMGSTIAETLRRYEGDYAALLGKQGEKLRSLWGAYEVPDNPSFYYAARVSPVVRLGMRFLPVAALGLTGLSLALARCRRGETRAALLPLFVAGAHAVFLLAHVNSRYRQPLAMALILLAAGAAAWAWERPRRRAGGLAAAAIVLMLILPKAPPAGYGYERPAEFVMVARAWQQRGEPGRAIAEMEAAVGAARREEPYRPFLPTLLYELGTIQADAGRRADAAVSFRAVLAEDPAFEEAAQALRQLDQPAPE